MKAIDPGHVFLLDNYDTPPTMDEAPVLYFMKREGEGYPGNVGHHAGTNLQEVFRACISRLNYLDKQIPCVENFLIITGLRTSLRLLEERAATRHGLEFNFNLHPEPIEEWPTCPTCGHVMCKGHDALR